MWKPEGEKIFGKHRYRCEGAIHPHYISFTKPNANVTYTNSTVLYLAACFGTTMSNSGTSCVQVYRGADKSLARPGRKKATATKLTFASHSKKKFRSLSVHPGLRGGQWPPRRTKNGDLSIVFSVGSAEGLISTPVKPAKTKQITFCVSICSASHSKFNLQCGYVHSLQYIIPV